MTVNWEKTEKNKGELKVEVDAERVNQALDQAFKKVVKDVSIPGFRKGKVPRFIFEQRFGPEALYEDAVNILVPEVYPEAIEESGIEPVEQPELDIEQIEKGKNMIFKATVTVKPEVELGQYKELEVVEKDPTVTDEDIENEVKQQQEKLAELVVKENGKVADGDTVVLDFEGFVDGEPFEGGKAENHSLEIGSGSFIPGFEEQLIGAENDEEKDITVTFPEDYQAEELSGKEATFSVKIHEIKQKEWPELDDEFAKDVDENVETLEELKTSIRERLEEERQQEAENHKKDSVVEKASEKAEVELPEPMIETEIDRIMQEFEQQVQSQGATLDMFLQMTNQTKEDLREQMKVEAERRLRANLTLEAISKVEEIEASEEDVENELANMAETYNQSVEEIKKVLSTQGGGTDAIKEDLKLRNTVDFLVDNSIFVSEEESSDVSEEDSNAEAVEEENGNISEEDTSAAAEKEQNKAENEAE